MNDRTLSLQNFSRTLGKSPNPLKETLIELTEIPENKPSPLEKSIFELVKSSRSNLKSIRHNADLVSKLVNYSGIEADPGQEKAIRQGISKIAEKNYEFFAENKGIIQKLAGLRVRLEALEGQSEGYQSLYGLIEFQIKAIFQENEREIGYFIELNGRFEEIIKQKTFRRIQNLRPDTKLTEEEIGRSQCCFRENCIRTIAHFKIKIYLLYIYLFDRIQ